MPFVDLSADEEKLLEEELESPKAKSLLEKKEICTPRDFFYAITKGSIDKLNAVCGGHEGIIKLLLDNDAAIAAIETQNIEGNTPLHLAADQKKAVIKLLLERIQNNTALASKSMVVQLTQSMQKGILAGTNKHKHLSSSVVYDVRSKNFSEMQNKMRPRSR